MSEAENLVRINDRWCGHHLWLHLRWRKSLSFYQLWVNHCVIYKYSKQPLPWEMADITDTHLLIVFHVKLGKILVETYSILKLAVWEWTCGSIRRPKWFLSPWSEFLLKMIHNNNQWGLNVQKQWRGIMKWTEHKNECWVGRCCIIMLNEFAWCYP